MHPVEPASETAQVDPEPTQRDQTFVLLVGFTIGMLIAVGFLVYIVLSAAKLLT